MNSSTPMMPTTIPTHGITNPKMRPITMSAMARQIMSARFPRRPTAKLEVDHDEPVLGQLAHRVRRAFARVARVLHATVGHLVGAERRRLVDDHATELELLRRAQRAVEAGREDPGLEAV